MTKLAHTLYSMGLFSYTFFLLQGWHLVKGLLICPKIAEAKIMIKHSAFLYTPQRKNKQTNKQKTRRKKMVLYMGRNNINSKLTDKG